MSKTPKPRGRAVADEKGNRSWTWTSDDNVDTARVRALGEDLSLETPPQGEGHSTVDPYNRTSSSRADPQKPAKRRTLDDMRRLSEHIKRKKIWKRED